MIKIHFTDASFRRIANVAMNDDIIALARRVDAGDISGDELREAIRNLSRRYDVPEFQLWGRMGEIRAQEREEREVLDELRKEQMKPYTFDPDLYVESMRSAEVGGQTHLPSYSSDEANIGDFGADKDPMSDLASGGKSDVLAEGSIGTSAYEHVRPLGDPTWGTPNREVYSNPLEGSEGFPGFPGKNKSK